MSNQGNYDPNFKGVLFKNDKNGNDRRPDYRGSCVINDVDMNMSAWIKASKKTGDKFLSIRFEAKDAFKGRSDGPKKAEPKPQRSMTEDNWSDLDEPF